MQPTLMKGFSAFYLIKKPQELPILYDQQRVVRVRPGLFAQVRAMNSISQVPLTNDSEVLTLIPRRDITKIKKINDSSSQDSTHRFVLIIHDPFKNESQRKKYSRLLARTPVIRIRPGILLAPQIRATRWVLYQKILLRPSQFIFRLIELGSEVLYVPKIELIHPSSEVIIERLIRLTIEKRVTRIVKACRQLYKQLKNPLELNQLRKRCQKRFKAIQQGIRFLRWLSKFYTNEFGVNLQNLVDRAVSSISRVHQQMKFCDI